jgi:hypothetical protein
MAVGFGPSDWCSVGHGAFAVKAPIVERELAFGMILVGCLFFCREVKFASLCDKKKEKKKKDSCGLFFVSFGWVGES